MYIFTCLEENSVLKIKSSYIETLKLYLKFNQWSFSEHLHNILPWLKLLTFQIGISRELLMFKRREGGGLGGYLPSLQPWFLN